MSSDEELESEIKDVGNHGKWPSYKECSGIPDKDIEHLLSSIDSNKALEFLRDSEKDKNFIETYECWLFSNKDYSIKNLDKDKFQPYIMLGTSQSFHDFYQIHHDRVLKIRKGEYPYHQVFFSSINRKWGWIDNEEINSDDFVILSYPFSGNGSSSEEEIKEILDLCNKYNVPVLLDCALWGLSTPLSICLKQYPCIKMISFSLSKFFNVGRLRIGMMYSQYEGKASGAILAPYCYTNSWSSYIGLQLIDNFSIDYMNKKYRNIQKNMCKKLNVFPSDTLLFGIGNKDSWHDEKLDRICLSRLIRESHDIDFKKY